MDQLLEQYMLTNDALVQYKKEVREATKEKNAELEELGEQLRAEMIEQGVDELEYNDRVVTLKTKLHIAK